MAAGVSRPRRGWAYPPAFVVYLAVLVAVTAAFLPAGLGEVVRQPFEALVWTGLVATSNLLAIPMLPKVRMDASLGAPVAVAAAVVLSPPFAMIVNLFGLTNERELRGQAPLAMSVFNRTQVGLSAGAASFAAAAVPGGPLAETLVAVVVFNVVNILAVTLSLWTRDLARLPEATAQSTAPFPRFAVDYGLVALMAAFVVLAYERFGLVGVTVLVLPLLLGYSALRSARVAHERAEQLAARVADLEILSGLGADLLTVRDRHQVPKKGVEALRHALSSPELPEPDVEVALSGEGRTDLRSVPILGAEPAAVRVLHGLDDSAMAVVEAVAGLMGMALQRLELERELSEVERARVALSGRILEEGTRERSRIALDIHDEVLPYFAAAGIQADNVRSAISVGDHRRADELADRTRGAVHDGITQLRQVLDALQRQIVVPGGLRPGLVEALEELRLKHGVEGALHADDPLPPLPLAVEILVLETVRGCLANVASHAHAESVTVSLAVGERYIAVEVRDDGSGFDPSTIEAGGHGLTLMAQRVELARGRFTVDSGPGAGTTVKVEVPV